MRAEGVFWLRYRCFDLFSSIANPATHPVLAECAGGRFRVYSTKDFPGLAASTELTQVCYMSLIPSLLHLCTLPSRQRL